MTPSCFARCLAASRYAARRDRTSSALLYGTPAGQMSSNEAAARRVSLSEWLGGCDRASYSTRARLPATRLMHGKCSIDCRL
jgi:hypothetical protein